MLRACEPAFIFIPIYSVVYSIYTRTCTVATYPFASGALRQLEIISLNRKDKCAYRFDFNINLLNEWGHEALIPAFFQPFCGITEKAIQEI